MYLHRCPLATLLILTIAGSVASCSSSDGADVTGTPPVVSQASILDRAAALGLTTFVELASLSSFAGALEGMSDITVFAPSESAFAALDPSDLDVLRDSQNLAQLDALISRSIVTGEFTAALIEGFGSLANLNGTFLQVDVFDSIIRIDGAVLQSSDLTPDNGILHTVDRVLEVPLAALDELRDEGFEILCDLVELSGIEAEFNGGALTILAPTDAAFMALPPSELAAMMDLANVTDTREKLRTHLLGGLAPISRLVADGTRLNAEDALIFVTWDGASSPAVNGAAFNVFNVPTTSSLIHGIDQVIARPLSLDDALMDPRLQVLETLIFASSIQPSLEQAQGITLFAPSNNAFAGLPMGVFDSLVQPMSLEILRTLLRSHVGADPLAFSALRDGDLISTLEGTVIAVSDPGTGALRLDDSANFVVTDVYLVNGVVHIIDAVLAADDL